MRMIMKVTLPNKAFNSAVKKGSVGQKMQAILEEMKPEAVYFTDMDGCRTGIIVFDLEKPSMVPAMVEPWFLNFNARVEFPSPPQSRMTRLPSTNGDPAYFQRDRFPPKSSTRCAFQTRLPSLSLRHLSCPS